VHGVTGMSNSSQSSGPACPLPRAADLSGVTTVSLRPSPPDVQAALKLADEEAKRRLGDAMLLSWYDRDRNFEAPQHVSECHQDSAVPGYVDYALSRGATLRIDFDDGRYVFFFCPVEL